LWLAQILVSVDRLLPRNPLRHIVRREAVNRHLISLHAVIEMVETASEQMTHRGRLAGGGLKPPKGAVVKSYGAERLGKGYTTSIVRYG
jgi:hypothetical protein